jgi:hypothetical protein
MPDTTPREQLILALEAAAEAKRGVPPELQLIVRAFARAERLQGAEIGSVLVTVKKLVEMHAGADAIVFTPKVVGWTIAGYFYGAHCEK